MKNLAHRCCAAAFSGALMLSGPSMSAAAALPVIQPVIDPPAAHVETIRYHGGGFPAAALGVFALGATAAVLASRRHHRDCGYYYDCGYDAPYYGGAYYGGGGFGGRRRGGFRGGGHRGGVHAGRGHAGGGHAGGGHAGGGHAGGGHGGGGHHR